MLVCGEPSGDQLGGQLIAALRSTVGESAKINGVGGRAMAAQGLRTLFPLDDTAGLGVRAGVAEIPRIFRRNCPACDVALATRTHATSLIRTTPFSPPI